MTLTEVVERLAVIQERLDTIAEVRLLLEEKAWLEAEISAERPSTEVKRLLEWIDADPQPLIQKAARGIRRNGH